MSCLDPGTRPVAPTGAAAAVQNAFILIVYVFRRNRLVSSLSYRKGVFDYGQNDLDENTLSYCQMLNQPVERRININVYSRVLRVAGSYMRESA